MVWTKFYFPLAALAILLKPVQAEPTVAENIVDKILQKRVQVFPKENTFDDYITELSRLSETNVLVDVTSVPQDLRATPYPGTAMSSVGLKGKFAEKWGPSLQNVMADLSQQVCMTHAFDGKGTFLFWKEPELLTIGQLIAETELANPVVVPLGVGHMSRVLSKYLVEAGKWDGKTQSINIKVPLSEIPQDLQSDILNEARAVFLQRISGRHLSRSHEVVRGEEVKSSEHESIKMRPTPTLWFDETFWKKACLKVGAAKIGLNVVPTVPLLFVGGYVATNEGQEAPLTTVLESFDVRLLALSEKPKFEYINAAGSYVASVMDSAKVQDKIIDENNVVSVKTREESPPTLQSQVSLYPEHLIKHETLTSTDDPNLARLVSLEVHRLPVSDVVSDLQRKSGVTLSCHADIDVEKKLMTGRIYDTPLAEILNLLSRLFPVKWRKVREGSYIMESKKYDELESQLLQLGAPYMYRIRFNMSPGKEEVKSQDIELREFNL